ncbi:MAG: RdgB/HAM1 family non-canonical purine NTP pyrophosphatase [Deltaproteobacteria bacterium]|nr:RdgB/HAM1 family non-canonical purine NTP pyrophosphatase [Deltaproteobacteria bacterium]
MKILVASTNPGKIREISEILFTQAIQIVTPPEIDLKIDVIEDGVNFLENATKKAREWSQASGMNALADDSGLSVKALGGLPGVMSARFAGADATDEDNNQLLLQKMAGQTNREAEFICVVVLALTSGDLIIGKGSYRGCILDRMAGSGGFGYDPLFYDPSSGKTFAELTPGQKNKRSHRRRALFDLERKLSGFIKNM